MPRAVGLGLSPDQLCRRMGWLPQAGERPTSAANAIAADERLTAAQKSALVQTYQAMVGDS